MYSDMGNLKKQKYFFKQTKNNRNPVNLKVVEGNTLQILYQDCRPIWKSDR